MSRLLGIVISWNRPELLRRTLKSLFLQIEDTQPQIAVVDNGSDSETLAVITREERIEKRVLLGSNLGINRALEAALPDDVSQEFQHILISDADMEYRRPLGPLLQAFNDRPEIGAIIIASNTVPNTQRQAR